MVKFQKTVADRERAKADQMKLEAKGKHVAMLELIRKESDAKQMGMLELIRKEANAQLLQQEDQLARARMDIQNKQANQRQQEFIEDLKEGGLNFTLGEQWIGTLGSTMTQVLNQTNKEFLKDQRKQNKKLAKEKAELYRQTKIEVQKEKAKYDLKTLPVRLHHDAQMAKLDHKNSMEKLRLYGDAARDFVTDPQKLGYTAAFIGGCALLYFGSRKGTSVAGDYVAARLGKPKLVTETSRLTLGQRLKQPLLWPKRLFTKEVSETYDDVILSPNLKEQMLDFAHAVKNTNAHKGFHRHAILYGPPGTGKTLMARKIAQDAGMDYAIMSGANFDQFNDGDAITELNRLFDWAEKSPRGLALFIDEADAFLINRDSPNVSERTRKLLNAFLARTGTETDKFAIFLATNRPHVLDKAVLDRIDEKMAFPLPEQNEREQLLRLYIDKWVLHHQNGAKIKLENFDDNKVSHIAHMTEGFSGRELSKLAIAMQAKAFSVPDKMLTDQMMDDIVSERVKQHQEALAFSTQL